MACVPVSYSGSARAPDPTIALRQALMGFESILTKEQKQEYKDNANLSDITGVIAFVAEIDANNNNAIRRCVAPRLCTFLEATQQFSEVVGLFVSSNPQIAALVWGGVKTAILTVSNITSYFGKVTSMIMEIGRSCPTYQQFGQLYPGSVGLQRELCDYYAVIIQLCTKIIEVSRRPLITQTLSSIFNPFESDFKNYIEKLRQAASDIQQQISLASKKANNEAKKLLEQESENHAVFRKLTSKFQRDSRKEFDEAHLWRIRMMERETAKLRSNIRDNLSTINYVKPWKQAMRQRVPATAEWFHREAVFHEWQSDQNTAILWCPGKMGAGKTVLMSNVVAQLHAARNTGDAIAYYFCRSDDIASLSARNIFGSLARQILEPQIKHTEDENLQRLYEDSQDLNTAEIVQFLLCRLQANKRYYLVIDGLDECETVEIRKVAQSVARLCDASGTNLKFLFAGRPELENCLFGSRRPKFRIPLAESKVDLDMDRFIETTLRLYLEEEQLRLGDAMLIVEISEALREGSKGMFLWVRLFIEDLCAYGSDSEILEALKHPPRGISEIFDRRLCRIRKASTAKDAIKILQYCGVLKRPLTLMEYREALSISPGQSSLNRQGLLNDMDKVVRDCCGLAFTDEEDNTVHYVHHSVKQHLFTSSLSRSDGFDSSRLDSHLGVLCMTYLDFTDLKGRLSKVMNGSNTPIKPMQLGISQLGSPGGSTGRMALKLLSNRHQFRDISPREIERKAQELLRHEDSDPQTRIMEQDFHFLEYARYNWVTHITDIDPDEVNPTWRLFCRCVEEDDIVLCKPWESMQGTDETRPDMPGTIKWLLAHGNPSLLMYYIKRQPHILTDQAKHEIFQAFILQGNIRLVEWILQHGDISTDPIPHGIFLASRNGLGDIQEILLRGVVDVDSRVHDQTALQAAAAEGHLKIVERLLVAKADVNARAGYPSRHTALQLAAANGHLEVVERLLIAKADVNALPEPAYLHLGQISTRGFGETVDRLLATKTNIYSLAKFGYTRLQVATIQGYLESAERLLATKDTLSRSGHTALRETIMQCHRYFLERIIAANADVNTPRYPAKLFQPTPLQAAAAEGHLEIVETLLATTNDNMTLRGGHSVTKLASVNSYLEMVERLLAKGAHIEAPLQGFSGTALQVAVNNGHLKIVERLIAANADVNAASRGYLGTALQAAASKGHLEIVERLLAANADVNAPGHPTKMFQQTALQAAAEEGHLEIVKRLLAAGANVNAPPQGINGETALRSALKTRDHVDLVKCLEQHMEARIDD